MRGDAGACMMEFAIVIPVLVFMLFAGVETARALGNYLRLSQIAYEGARIGASLPGLEVGRYTDESTYTSGSRQARLREIIVDVIDEYRENASLNASNVSLLTEYQRTTLDASPSNRVSVELMATYTPLFGFGFPELNIRVFATSPYLFPDS